MCCYLRGLFAVAYLLTAFVWPEYALGATDDTSQWSMAAADDAIPGVVLSSPQLGDLNPYDDSADVYSLSLTAGETLSLLATATPTAAGFDLLLYPPGTKNTDTAIPVASSIGGTMPKSLSYRVPPGATGTYYLLAATYLESGEYRIVKSVKAAESDDDIPGVPISGSPVGGSLSVTSDPDDVYSISIPSGKRLVVSLTGDANTDFDVQLFAGTSKSIYGDEALALMTSDKRTYPDVIVYDVAPSRAGAHYLRVSAGEGSGSYSLTYSLVDQNPGDNLPGMALGASPIVDKVDSQEDPYDVYRLSLPAGARLSGTLTLTSGSADLLLMSPGSIDVHSDDPLVVALKSGLTRSLTYTSPPPGGEYLLVVRALSPAGYSLAWTVNVLTPTALSMSSGSRSIAFGGSASIKGRLTSAGKSAPRRLVWLESSSDGISYAGIASVLSAPDGTVSFAVRPSIRTYYRLAYLGEELLGPSVSTAVQVKVPALVTKPSSASTVRVNRRFRVYGYLKPRHAAGQKSVSLKVYRQKGSGWTYVKTVRALNSDYSSHTRYETYLSLPSRGVWRFKAVHSDAGHISSGSAYRQVTVVK